MAEEIMTELESCLLIADQISQSTHNPEVLILCELIKGLGGACAKHFLLSASNIDVTRTHSIVIEHLVS